MGSEMRMRTEWEPGKECENGSEWEWGNEMRVE